MRSIGTVFAAIALCTGLAAPALAAERPAAKPKARQPLRGAALASYQARVLRGFQNDPRRQHREAQPGGATLPDDHILGMTTQLGFSTRR